MVSDLSASSIGLFIHNDEVVVGTSVSDLLKNTPSVNFSDVYQSLDLECTEVDITAERNVDFQGLLNKNSEKPCQEKMNDLANTLQAADSSGGKCGLTFTIPRTLTIEGDACENYYPLTGKPDLISIIAPQAIEIKSNKLSARSERSLQPDMEADEADISSSSSSSSAGSAATGTNAGIRLEMIVKTTEVMVQCLERLYCLRSVAAQLAYAIEYGSTASHAFMLVFKRVYKDGRLSECIKIYPILHSDVLVHWASINKLTVDRPHWFLTPDGLALNQTLLQMGLHPATCITQVAKQSIRGKNKVYFVSLAVAAKYQSAGDKLKPCLAATKRSYDFCLKMTKDKGYEATVLQCLAPAYNKKYLDRQFYALGTVRAVVSEGGGEDESKSESRGESATSEEGTLIESCAGVSASLKEELNNARDFPDLGLQQALACPTVWNYYGHSLTLAPPDISTEAVAIVMRVGDSRERFKTLGEWEWWANGVVATLIVLHAMGYVHADVRFSNVMWFNDHWQLTDYDLAVGTGSTVTLQAGGRFNDRGSLLQDCSVGDEVEWRIDHDYDMTMCTMFKNSTSLEKSES